MLFDNLQVILLIIFIIIVGIYFYKRNSEHISITSTIDNNTYKVRGELEDKQKAANRIAEIRQRLLKLKTHFEQKMPDDERVARFLKNFRTDAHIFVETPADSSYTSFTQNKGEKVSLCVRHKNDEKHEQIVELNTMMFVALHEMGHIMSISVGHEQEFWDNFRFILEEAIKIGIYSYQDFQKSPEKYCGVTITDTPLKV